MAYLKSSDILIFQFQSDLAAVTNADAGQLAFCNDVQTSFNWNGTTWMPLGRTAVKKSLVNVNGKVTGATKIYTMEASALKFYPVNVIFRVINVFGVTVAPTISVGTNSTAYNNIVSASLLSSLLATLGATGGAPQNVSASYPITGATDIYANVTIAGVATNYTVAVEIIGFYDNN